MYSTVCETAVEYDNAGNLTRDHRGCRYVYDYENKITRIFIDENANGVHDAGVDANIVEFTYDALGWRIERTNPSGTALRYYYDDQRVVLRTNVDSGGVESDSRSFVFGNYIDEVLIMRNPAGIGYDYYYAHDHLYSPAVLFNSSGAVAERYEYDAYGMRSMYSGTWAPRTSSPMGNFYAFTGRELDYLDGGNLRIMYYRARYYDPETGRFMQRDPLGIDPAGGKRNPFIPARQYAGGINVYEYVNSNVLQFVDPFGLISYTLTYNFECRRGADGKLYAHIVKGVEIESESIFIAQSIPQPPIPEDAPIPMPGAAYGTKYEAEIYSLVYDSWDCQPGECGEVLIAFVGLQTISRTGFFENATQKPLKIHSLYIDRRWTDWAIMSCCEKKCCK